MAEAEKPWDAVFNQVRVTRWPGCVYPHPPQVSENSLDAAEKQFGTRFPESYRAFMTRFGPGEIEGRISLRRPTAEEIGDETGGYYDFLEYVAERFAIDLAWIHQLVLFASDGLGDAYGWHPAEITSSTPHECRFYHIQRAPLYPPHVVGNTFVDLLHWAVIEATEGSTEAIQGFQFTPRALRLRTTPKHSDVQNWLFFNNRTARLIARSIRDQGRVEAFPILADALQDAGCTNADLLDSCRTGDPDIDGAWVLQVLLGKG